MSSPTPDRPLVSAIIAAYDAADTIGAALDSIRSQTYDNIEIVVCDDGSTDDTASVVRALCSQAVYVQQENAGPAAARNTAAAAASGDFLATLDADDRWLPPKIERQLAVLRLRPEIGAVATNGIVVAGDRRYPWLSTHAPRMRELSVSELLRGHRNPIFPSLMCRAEVFRALGGYDPDLSYGEDLDLYCRLAASGAPVHVLAEPLYLYVRGERALTGRGITQHARDILRIVEKMDPRVEHEGYRSPLAVREFSDAYGERLLRLAWAHMHRGERGEAEGYLKRIEALPAPGFAARGLAGLARRNWGLFRRIFAIERRANHLAYFTAGSGFVGGVQRWVATRDE